MKNAVLVTTFYPAIMLITLLGSMLPSRLNATNRGQKRHAQEISAPDPSTLETAFQQEFARARRASLALVAHEQLQAVPVARAPKRVRHADAAPAPAPEQPAECSICSEPFSIVMRHELMCEHDSFCTTRITKWAKSNAKNRHSCPECRIKTTIHLTQAVTEGHATVVKNLLHRDQDKLTPRALTKALTLAHQENHNAIIELLVAAGAQELAGGLPDPVRRHDVTPKSPQRAKQAAPAPRAPASTWYKICATVRNFCSHF